MFSFQLFSFLIPHRNFFILDTAYSLDSTLVTLVFIYTTFKSKIMHQCTYKIFLGAFKLVLVNEWSSLALIILYAPTFFDRVNYLRGVHVNVSKPLSYLTLLGDVKTQ